MFIKPVGTRYKFIGIPKKHIRYILKKHDLYHQLIITRNDNNTPIPVTTNALNRSSLFGAYLHLHGTNLSYEATTYIKTSLIWSTFI